MQLKRGIDKAVDAVVAELKKLSKPIKDQGDRPGRHVCANQDEESAK